MKEIMGEETIGEAAFKKAILNGIPIFIPIPLRLLLLLAGCFMIFCELLWINGILAGNVPPERMGEYIVAILLGLGIVVGCFWGFWKMGKKKKSEKERLVS